MASAIDKLKIHGVSPVERGHVTLKRGKAVITSESIREQISKLLDDEMARGTYNMQATNAPPVVHRMAFLAKLRAANGGLTPVDTGGVETTGKNTFMLHGRQVRSSSETHYDQHPSSTNREPGVTSSFPKSARTLRSGVEAEESSGASVSSLPVLNTNNGAGFSRSLQSWSSNNSPQKNGANNVGELEIGQASLMPADFCPVNDNYFYHPGVAWDEPDYYTYRKRMTRRDRHKPKSESLDFAELETCLNITRSAHQSKMADEPSRLKHNTQYMLRPLSQTSLTSSVSPRRDTPELKPSNYYFGSIESYLHFRHRHGAKPSKSENDRMTLNGASFQKPGSKPRITEMGALRLITDSNKPTQVVKHSVVPSDAALNSHRNGSAKMAEVKFGTTRQRHVSSDAALRQANALDNVDGSDEEPWPGSSA